MVSNILLILILFGMFLFGYFVVDRAMRYSKRNYKKSDKVQKQDKKDHIVFTKGEKHRKT